MWHDVYCRSGGHCQACRSDPAWRKATGAPEVCPGRESVVVRPARVKRLAAALPCGTCGEKRSCANVTVCCGGQESVVVRVPCRLGNDLGA